MKRSGLRYGRDYNGGTSALPGSDSSSRGRKPAGRAPRTDALRNRAALIAAARAAFAGGEANVSLEEIARGARVGIGTLYRHFSTREALVEAVYAAELDDVTECLPELLRRHAPDVALRAWMARYARFVATKVGMAETLRTGWASGRIATPDTRRRITVAIGTVLEHGAAEGVLRSDVDPEDATVLLLGVLLTAIGDESDVTTRVNRLLDLVLDALRPIRR